MNTPPNTLAFDPPPKKRTRLSTPNVQQQEQHFHFTFNSPSATAGASSSSQHIRTSSSRALSVDYSADYSAEDGRITPTRDQNASAALTELLDLLEKEFPDANFPAYADDLVLHGLDDLSRLVNTHYLLLAFMQADKQRLGQQRAKKLLAAAVSYMESHPHVSSAVKQEDVEYVTISSDVEVDELEE